MEAEFQRRLFAPESSPPSFSWYTNPLLRRPHQERQEQRSSRNWLHLPVELILIIFEKLGAIEVLTSVQRVCMLWRTICKDPYTWRVINMRVVGFPKFMDYQLSSLCRRTIERSCGLLVDISIDYFATEDLLNDIANFCGSRLRRLRLNRCYYRISPKVLCDLAKKCPWLKELDITHCYCITPSFLESFGQACPLLKTFKFNYDRPLDHYYISSRLRRTNNEYAYAIARSMPQLRRLQLLGSTLDYDGLHAILNGCPHLESLDLRHCINCDTKREIIIEMVQGRIMNFRLSILGASTIDYEFCSLLPYEEAMRDWGFNALVEEWHMFQARIKNEKISKLALVKYEDEEVWEDIDMIWVTVKNKRRHRFGTSIGEEKRKRKTLEEKPSADSAIEASEKKRKYHESIEEEKQDSHPLCEVRPPQLSPPEESLLRLRFPHCTQDEITRRLRRLGKEPTASFTRLPTALPTRPSLSGRFALSRRMKAFLARISRDSLLMETQHRNIIVFNFSGYTETLDQKSDIVVLEDDHGLYAIDILDPSLLTKCIHLTEVYHFHDMIDMLVGCGYKKGTTLLGYGYDFRQSNRIDKLMDGLKAKLLLGSSITNKSQNSSATSCSPLSRGSARLCLEVLLAVLLEDSYLQRSLCKGVDD
ncbi:hypothetical protein HN873_068429 [Arachis hypogaea]